VRVPLPRKFSTGTPSSNNVLKDRVEDMQNWLKTRNALECPDIRKLVPGRREKRVFYSGTAFEAFEVYFANQTSLPERGPLGYSGIGDCRFNGWSFKDSNLRGNVVFIKHSDIVRSVATDVGYNDQQLCTLLRSNIVPFEK
jgi:hypothetical protein